MYGYSFFFFLATLLVTMTLVSNLCCRSSGTPLNGGSGIPQNSQP